MVLDSAGLEQLAAARPADRFRALLAVAAERGREVVVPSVVCAEVCRGAPRTRAVEAALGRHARARGRRPAVSVVDVDLRLAKQIGAILHAARAATDDLERLAAVVPAVRIITAPAT